MKFKNTYKIRESYSSLEPQEIFLDTLAHAKEEEMGISEKKFELEIKEKVIYSIFGFFIILAFALLFKTFWWQIVQGANLQRMAENNKGGITLIRPERGIIYDRNLKKLVLNAPAYDLVCLPQGRQETNKENLEEEITIIAPLSGKTKDELFSEFASSQAPEVVIIENIAQENLLILEARMNDLPDCRIEKNTIRNYVASPEFSHLLGYMGKITKEDLQQFDGYALTDNIGKTGLERYYEGYLRGNPGRTEVVKNSLGVKKGDNILSLPESGQNLVLHVDFDLQKKTYESLEKSIKNIGAKKGAAVALDPRSGAVLALVSYPSYNNNVFSERISKKDFDALLNDPYQPFFNRAIGAKYPTGSTIKPFLASAALEEQIISQSKLINDPGYILVHSQYDPSVTYRFGGVVPHGLVDMRKALAVSSNIYFYTIGGGYEDQQGLGPSRIKKYLDLYGWEEKTGIDLPGEFSGFVPSPEWKKRVKKESWWDGDTYNLSIGQSDLQVTPLQVALAYAAIANGGTLYKPQIVSKIISGSGDDAKLMQEFNPEVIRSNFIDSENLKIVREGMRDGVQKAYGSSFILNDLPVAVAGKTGTAETNKEGFFNTWSSNFAPYNNPEIVFVATIEGVEGLRSATLPVAKEVLQYYFTRK